MTRRDVCYDVTHSFSTNHKTATETFLCWNKTNIIRQLLLLLRAQLVDFSVLFVRKGQYSIFRQSRKVYPSKTVLFNWWNWRSFLAILAIIAIIFYRLLHIIAKYAIISIKYCLNDFIIWKKTNFSSIIANKKKKRNIYYGYVKTRFPLCSMFRHKPPYELRRHI